MQTQTNEESTLETVMTSAELFKLTTDVTYILANALFKKYGPEKVLSPIEVEMEAESIFGENFILASSVFNVLFEEMTYVPMSDIADFTKSMALLREDLEESEFLESAH